VKFDLTWTTSLQREGCVTKALAPRRVYSEAEEYSDPSWDQVETLIRRMNGASRTDVFLGDPDAQHYLAVSGGNDGRYIVGIQEPEAYYLLMKPENGRRELRVVVGGLPDYLPAAEIHDMHTTLAVAQYYWQTGQREPRFDWHKRP
jgi:hypothetical protein